MRKPTTLKLAIVSSGLRQKDIAEQVGLDEPSMSRIVNGLHCDDVTRQKIACALDREVHELWPSDHPRVAA
jgi:predicted XRE-type DNA-binding protein